MYTCISELFIYNQDVRLTELMCVYTYREYTVAVQCHMHKVQMTDWLKVYSLLLSVMRCYILK